MSGEKLSSAQLSLKGIDWDREFMLTDTNGRFLTQREIPKLALFNTSIKENTLIITHRPTGSSVAIDLLSTGLSNMNVSIWKREHNATIVNSQASDWLSDLLDCHIKLVRVASETGYTRPISGKTKTVNINFPDGYPLLLAASESLNDLNKRLSVPVSWDRFRPNIVIETKDAYEEDNWSTIKMGSQFIHIVKPCGRCKIIATDQSTGILTKEPLATLSTYRNMGNSVAFGMYGCTLEPGEITIGQEVSIK